VEDSIELLIQYVDHFNCVCCKILETSSNLRELPYSKPRLLNCCSSLASSGVVELIKYFTIITPVRHYNGSLNFVKMWLVPEVRYLFFFFLPGVFCVDLRNNRSIWADIEVFVSIWRVVPNILNKQSRTAHKGWTSSLGWAWGCKLTIEKTTLATKFHSEDGVIWTGFIWLSIWTNGGTR
jgi:hypothetical protein